MQFVSQILFQTHITSPPHPAVARRGPHLIFDLSTHAGISIPPPFPILPFIQQLSPHARLLPNRQPFHLTPQPLRPALGTLALARPGNGDGDANQHPSLGPRRGQHAAQRALVPAPHLHPPHPQPRRHHPGQQADKQPRVLEDLGLEGVDRLPRLAEVRRRLFLFPLFFLVTTAFRPCFRPRPRHRR